MAFKIKKIKPLFTGVVTTSNKYQGERYKAAEYGLIIDTGKRDGGLNPYQTVVAVGTMVKDVKPGDVVKINFKRYVITQHTPGAIDEAQNKQFDNMSLTYEIPTVEMDDNKYLYLQINDIEYIVEEYDGVSEGGLLE